jgi:hypothetical protein
MSVPPHAGTPSQRTTHEPDPGGHRISFIPQPPKALQLIEQSEATLASPHEITGRVAHDAASVHATLQTLP